jgi:tetratricopeptide (TPR) repeat protein
MNPIPASQTQAVRIDPNALPPPKWWGRYELAGDPPQRRFALRWKRIVTALGTFLLFFYLALVTALWGYYSIKRNIPGVNWIDIAILPRFSRVQDAIGASYYAEAKADWDKKEIVQAIFTGRAAVQKSPTNLDARLFLAGCWLKVGRDEEAIRTIRDGVEFSADDKRLQNAALQTCLETGHFQDLIKFLREDFPGRGVKLLEQPEWIYKFAEVRAVMETSGPAAAAAAASHYQELTTLPEAAPLLARIDLELGHGQQALERLKAARLRNPNDIAVLDSYANTAKRIGSLDLAQQGARQFLTAYPKLVDAQLCFLEMFGSRKGEDSTPWTAECMAFLTIHRHEPEAMSRLASLAASEGWADVAFLLYENSLQENLTGMPFAIYFTASLIKAGDIEHADAVWRQLEKRNSRELESASYIAAVLASAAGRQSEAMQILDSLRRETANNPARRRTMETIFRDFGYPNLADLLAADHP